MLPTKLTGGHTESVLCVDVYNETRSLVCGGENGEISLWRLTDKTLVKKSPLFPNSDCSSICFLPKHESYICAAFGNSVHVIDTHDLSRTVSSAPVLDDEINQIIASSDGSYIAACLDNGDILVYKIINEKETLQLKHFRTLRNKHTNICSTICFRYGQSAELFSGGFDCQLIHWNFMKIRCLNIFNMQEMQESSSGSSLMINPPFVHHVDVSADGNNLICGLGNGRIFIFDCSKKNIKPIRSFAAHSQHVCQVRFLDSNRFMSGGNDAYIRIWSIAEILNTVANSSDASRVDINDEHDETGAQSVNYLPTLQAIQHDHKVNWLTSFRDDVNDASSTIVVADTSPEISLYTGM